MWSKENKTMNDYGMRSLSEDSGNNLNHIHVESLCETISDFLDTLDGSTAEFNNEQLVEKRLSESECSILDCGLIVADIKNITEDIDKTFISTLERDRNELLRIFANLEGVTDQILPSLDQDLNEIEHLTSILEARLAKFNRDKSLGWIKKFMPGGAVKTREDHTLYTNQVAAIKTHSIEELLENFDTPSDKSANGSGTDMSVDASADVSVELNSDEHSDYAML